MCKIMILRIGLASLMVASLMTFSGCGAKPKDTAEAEVTEEKTEEPEEKEEESFEEIVARSYNDILDSIGSYDFGEYESEASPSYAYSLVDVEGNKAPLLLVKRDIAELPSSIRVFGYNETTHAVDAPEDLLAEGVAAVGGFRGSIKLTVEEPHIEVTTFSSGTGEGTVERVDFKEGKLDITSIWEGRIDQLADTEVGKAETKDIEWCDVSDRSILEKYSGVVFEAKIESEEAAVPAEETEEDVDESDENNWVLKGTLCQLNHDELLAMQGQQDPNPGYPDNEIYTIFVLSEPRELELLSSGGGTRSGMVQMIKLNDFSGDVQAYDGKTVKISFAKARTAWPSDASLPLGEPRSYEYVIME